MIYRSRLVILHNYVEVLLERPELIPTHQTQQQSNVPLQKLLDSLVVGLEFELRVYFRPLRALIIEQQREQKLFSDTTNGHVTKFDTALTELEDLISGSPLNRIPDLSKLCANTPTELVLRCFLLLEKIDINTEPSSIVSYLQKYFGKTTSGLKFFVLPAITHLACDKDGEVIYLASTTVKWNHIFPHEEERQIRHSRIDSESKERLMWLRKIYIEGLRDYPQRTPPTSKECILKDYHSKWKRRQREDGTPTGGLHFGGIVGAALRTRDMKKQDPCHMDKATLQFEYLFHTTGQYDYSNFGNIQDYPTDTCAEFENALKLIQSYSKFKRSLDDSLTWACADLLIRQWIILLFVLLCRLLRM